MVVAVGLVLWVETQMLTLLSRKAAQAAQGCLLLEVVLLGQVVLAVVVPHTSFKQQQAAQYKVLGVQTTHTAQAVIHQFRVVPLVRLDTLDSVTTQQAHSHKGTQ
jgi:hypothetical protein